jgi:hypothetical protein
MCASQSQKTEATMAKDFKLKPIASYWKLVAIKLRHCADLLDHAAMVYNAGDDEGGGFFVDKSLSEIEKIIYEREEDRVPTSKMIKELKEFINEGFKLKIDRTIH